MVLAAWLTPNCVRIFASILLAIQGRQPYPAATAFRPGLLICQPAPSLGMKTSSHSVIPTTYTPVPYPTYPPCAFDTHAQGPLRKSVGKGLRKCLEGSPTPPRDKKKRPRQNEFAGAGVPGHLQQQQQQFSSAGDEGASMGTTGRQRKKRRAREGGGDADSSSKSDNEVYI